jgi:putative membrane protein
MMYWYGGHMNGWGYGLGIFAMLIFGGILIAASVFLVRYLSRSARPDPAQHHDAPAPSPEQLLAERFARGEIDADEYRSCREILHEHPRPAAVP